MLIERTKQPITPVLSMSKNNMAMFPTTSNFVFGFFIVFCFWNMLQHSPLFSQLVAFVHSNVIFLHFWYPIISFVGFCHKSEHWGKILELI